MLRFSVFLSYGRIGRPEDFKTSVIEENLEQAIVAERLGFDMAWVPEHHLIHFMQAPSALMLATHVGSRTSFRIGTMTTLILYRHPLVTAGEIATADQILGGRLELGVGRGAYEYEFERMGLPFAEARPRFSEALEVLEALWHNEDRATAYDGQYNRFAESYIWPRPAQLPHPPVWLAAMTDPTIEWAAKKGYHVANWPFSSPMSRVATVARIFHENRLPIGHDGTPQKLTILRGAFAVDDRAKLGRNALQALDAYRIAHRLHFFTENSERGIVAPEPVGDEPDPAHIFDNLLVGTPDELLRKVAEYDELGVDEIMCSFNLGAPHEELLESMELFAREVIAPYRARYATLGEGAFQHDGWRRGQYGGDTAGGFGVDARELRAGRMT